MSQARPFAAFSTIALLAAFSGGCAGKAATKPQAMDAPRPDAKNADSAAESEAPIVVTERPPMQSMIVARPLPQAAGPTVIKQGALPLLYLVESSGTFDVTDATAGQTLVAAPASTGTIIRVDARSGVVVGQDTLVSGPLAVDHKYSIVREAAGDNESRSGYVSPKVP